MGTHATRRRTAQTLKLARDELEILSRLQYQGKNQYRAFLWWRRLLNARKKFANLLQLSEWVSTDVKARHTRRPAMVGLTWLQVRRWSEDIEAPRLGPATSGALARGGASRDLNTSFC
jgi:hypothetical protein